MKRDKEGLLTIGYVAKACGITSAAIINMEKKGFIKPAYVDENSGYRYYDDKNVAAILSCRRLESLGLTMQEAFEYVNGEADYEKRLLELRQSLKSVTYYVNELSLHLPDRAKHYFEFFEIPDLLCYTHIGEVMPGPDSDNFGHNVLSDAIKAGCTIRYDEALFGIRVESGQPTTYDHIPVKMCIPVSEQNLPDLPNIEVIPGGRLFSIVVCGLHEEGKSAHALLFEEMKRRGLRPWGSLRAYADVAPYTHFDIPTEQHITRYGILVESV